MINSFYSFVTPVKNQENEIYGNIIKLIKKIKKNTFIKYWEIIIIDDNSTDNSKQILNKYLKHPKIKVL